MPTQPFIQRLALENFRGIRSLAIDPIRRITLLGGLNGTGKTTLLDAIFQFMDSGNPTLLMRSGHFRQTPVTLQSLHRINEGVAPEKPGLHKFQTRQGKFEIKWSWGPQEMGPIEPRQLQVNAQPNGQSLNTQVGYHQLVHHDGKLVSSRHYAGEAIDTFMFRTDVNENFQLPVAYYLNRNLIFNSIDFANRYSTVVQAGLKKRFLEVVSSLSSNFDDAEILHIASNPVLHLTLDGRMLPITFAGDGIATVAAISLALMTARGGIVLLDEFDSSIHFSKLSDVWKIIHGLAVEFDVQVIAATHSGESAVALFDGLAAKDKNDAIFYRLDLVDGRNLATSYSLEEMKEAGAEGWEFR